MTVRLPVVVRSVPLFTNERADVVPWKVLRSSAGSVLKIIEGAAMLPSGEISMPRLTK